MKDNNQFVNYANGFQAVPRLGLERITYLMQLLGNPQDSLRCIHVAGTNGKGSVCAFTESMLLAAGYKVGKYISPNLVRVNERITVCREEISDGDLNALLAQIEKIIPEAERFSAIKFLSLKSGRLLHFVILQKWIWITLFWKRDSAANLMPPTSFPKT